MLVYRTIKRCKDTQGITDKPLSLSNSSNYYSRRKRRTIIPCLYALLTNENQAYRKGYTKILEIHPELNPFLIMVDVEKTAINAL